MILTYFRTQFSEAQPCLWGRHDGHAMRYTHVAVQREFQKQAGVNKGKGRLCHVEGLVCVCVRCTMVLQFLQKR
jgi:hypothetical protein